MKNPALRFLSTPPKRSPYQNVSPKRVTTKFLTQKSPQIANFKPPKGIRTLASKKAYGSRYHFKFWNIPSLLQPLRDYSESSSWKIRRFYKNVYFSRCMDQKFDEAWLYTSRFILFATCVLPYKMTPKLYKIRSRNVYAKLKSRQLYSCS